MSELRSVELRAAFHWFCEECSRENFSLPQKAELTELQAEDAYRQFHELDAWSPLPEGWRQFELWHIPDLVECGSCGTIFQAVDEEVN